MAETEVRGGQGSRKVKVDGEESILHITSQSVLFEKGGKIGGFEKNAIRMIKPQGEMMVIAYSDGNEIRSVKVEPMTAVASLLVPDRASDLAPSRTLSPTTSTALNEIFERLYRETKKELEERLAKVQGDPKNRSLRLTPDEEARCERTSRKLVNLMGTKYGFDPLTDDNPISFWGLEKHQLELQLDVVRVLHIYFLRGLVGPKAETEDIGYSAYEVWPDDWERILIRFKLTDGPFLTEKFKSYLKSHWKYRPGERKPVLASS